VAGRSRVLGGEHLLPAEALKNTTSTKTSTTAKTTAAFKLTTTETLVPSITPTQSVTAAQTTTAEQQLVLKSSRQLRPREATDSLPKSALQLLKCVCFTACRGYVGLKSHQRSCTVFRQLLKGPTAQCCTDIIDITDIDASKSTPAITQLKVQGTTISENIFTQPIETVKTITTTVAAIVNTDDMRSTTVSFDKPSDRSADSNMCSNSINKINSINNKTLCQSVFINQVIYTNKTANIIPVMQTIKDTVREIPSSSYGDGTAADYDGPMCPSHSIVDDLNRVDKGIPVGLKPLIGVPLPKTEAGWGEMNLFFHSGPLFRYA